MIQRIQSLYLLIVSALSVVIYFVPISKKFDPADPSVQNILEIRGMELFSAEPQIASGNLVLLIMLLLIAAASIVTIFNFRNRPGQIKLCMLNLILICFMIGTSLYLTGRMSASGNTTLTTVYQAGLYLLGVQALLIIMAMRAIRNDEKLIRSADRIR